MNREAYKKLLEENIMWLLEQPRSLERDHIESLLRYELKTLTIYKEGVKNDRYKNLY